VDPAILIMVLFAQVNLKLLLGTAQLPALVPGDYRLPQSNAQRTATE
jgi:hypothetical protein